MGNITKHFAQGHFVLDNLCIVTAVHAFEHSTTTVQVTGQPRIWFLQLVPHPEHEGSLRGEINTGSQRLPVVADLDEGDLTLEESLDGQHISATWLGTVNADSCGQSLSGQRQPAQGEATAFVMRRNQPR